LQIRIALGKLLTAKGQNMNSQQQSHFERLEAVCAKRWRWNRDDMQQAFYHLDQIGLPQGEDDWLKTERGLQAIAALDSERAAKVLVNLAKKNGGTTQYQLSSLALVSMHHPSGRAGAEYLASHGSAMDRQAARDAIEGRTMGRFG